MQQHGDSADGADGLSFFLVDGETTAVKPGESGGRLGYVNLSGDGGEGALAGVGFDTYGNFPIEGGKDEANCEPRYSDRVTDVLALRGGHDDNWCLLSDRVHDEDQTDWSQARTVRVIVDASTETSPAVRVHIDGATEPVLTVNQPGALREVDSFTFGFSASTGGSTNNHDLRDVAVRSLTALHAVSWVSDDLPAGQQGEPYEEPLAFTDAVAPATVSLTDGAMPAGLDVTLEDDRYAIVGTPEEAGSFTFDLTVEDTRDPPSQATRTFALEVAGLQPLTLTGGVLEGVIGGDDVELRGHDTARFTSNEVGEHEVSVDWGLTGADAGRYELSGEPDLKGRISKADVTLSFVEGMAWPAFGHGEEAARQPVVGTDPATDAATDEDLGDAVSVRSGPDDDLTETQPSQEGSYRVTATLEHDRYRADPLRSTVVVLAPSGEEDEAPEIGPVYDHDDDGDLTPPHASRRRPRRPRAGRTSMSTSPPRPWARSRCAPRATAGSASHSTRASAAAGHRAALTPRGGFDAEFATPGDLEAGEHTVQLNGRRASDGTVRSTSIGVLVDPAPRRAEPPDSPAEVSRHGGADQVATAATIATDAFADGADHAILATCGVPADALAATPLAAAHTGGVLVLIDGADPTRSQPSWHRLLEANPASVHLAGGSAAISEETAAALAASQ